MSGRSRREGLLHRIVAWALGWLFAAALYLLLIDNTDLPELLVGAGAAVLAATAFELAREQDLLRAEFRPGWLARAHRPLAKVPSDIVLVSGAAFRQMLRRTADVGEFRAVPFRAGEEELGAGRRALAESFGSFAPNTIIVGVDVGRRMILGHQLRRTGGREAIDVLELG